MPPWNNWQDHLSSGYVTHELGVSSRVRWDQSKANCMCLYGRES